MMPFLAGFFFFYARKRTPPSQNSSSLLGIPAATIGVVILVLANKTFASLLTPTDQLSLTALSLLLVYVGIFLLFFGLHATKQAAFPMLLLCFIIPLPSSITNMLAAFFSKTTAYGAYKFLSLLGSPVTLDGCVIHFPQMSILIAEECSGLASFFGLLIIGLIAGKLFLDRTRTRVIFVACILPIAMAKNVFRIFILFLVAIRYGEKVFASTFHRFFGFSIFALLLMAGVIVLCRVMERRWWPSDSK